MATRGASCFTAGLRRSARRRGSRRWPARRSGGPEDGRVTSPGCRGPVRPTSFVPRRRPRPARAQTSSPQSREPSRSRRPCESVNYQKRAPASRPPWIEVVALRFPSGRMADEIVPRDAAALAWMANLGCLELHPHPVRADDLEHPDELRIDLDPVPGVAWSQLQDVARVVRDVLADFGLVGWPKTSGSRGIHVYARIHR